MKLELRRMEFGTSYTIGRLYIDGAFQCYTLEDKVREVDGQPVQVWKVPTKTAIPKGTYKLIIDFSNRFQKDMPHILDVPGFEGIRIHSGNTSEDTEGCIIVGNAWNGSNFVSNSKIAFNALFSKLQAAKVMNVPMTIVVE